MRHDSYSWRNIGRTSWTRGERIIVGHDLLSPLSDSEDTFMEHSWSSADSVDSTGVCHLCVMNGPDRPSSGASRGVPKVKIPYRTRILKRSSWGGWARTTFLQDLTNP